MRTVTGTFLEAQRRAKHLTLGQLAMLLSYSNVSKGARRIQALEREGRTVEGLLENVVRVLGLDAEYVNQLAVDERRRSLAEWESWASRTVEPVLRFRAIPAVWCNERLPKGLSREAAIDHARSRAVERRLTYVLVWSRHGETWCYPDGTTYERTMKPGEVAGPYTRVAGHGNLGFIFG